MSTRADVARALDFAGSELIRYQRPELPPLEEVARYYALAEEARFYSNGGPCHERLAARLADHVGGGVACLPVANCTLGLIVALRESCGAPRPGRGLIAVPSFTFTATACAIRWAGYDPLFVDVDERDWQLDPDALDAALAAHPGVGGVLGCSTFGTAAPTRTRERWRQACAARGIPLVIDSAAGFGATGDDGRQLGGLGDTEVFSFHATKPFAIGEGGAILSADTALIARLAQAVNFGLDPFARVSTTAGLNAKMSELQAATALAMLDRFDGALSGRRATARMLQSRFAAHPLTYQGGSAGSTWQVLQLLVPDPDARRRALEAAVTLGVEVRTCFDPPLHRHPAFALCPRADTLEVTERLAARSLSLPLANALGERQATRLAQLLDATFAEDRC